MSLTLGEKRVRTTFNPSSSSNVQIIKDKSAELINLINELDVVTEDVGEFNRLKALAMTHVEDAAMWGVKAATIS